MLFAFKRVIKRFGRDFCQHYIRIFKLQINYVICMRKEMLSTLYNNTPPVTKNGVHDAH